MVKTRTPERTQEIVSDITEKLQSIGSALADERSNLEALRRQRLQESLSSKPSDRRLRELDSKITLAERNIEDLVSLQEGIEPELRRILAARDRVVRLERDLDQRRAQRAGSEAFGEVQDRLINDVLPAVKTARDIYRTAGLTPPPTLVNLEREIEGRWSTGSIAAHLELALRPDAAEGIKHHESALADARRHLADVAGDVAS